MADDAVDVVVVGAGLAGLEAARRLVAGGATVRVLEARERVGGRTLSLPVGRGVFDLGAQWMGPTQRRLAALARDLGIATFPTWERGAKAMDLDGRVRWYAGSIPALPPFSLLVLHRAMRALERLSGRVPLEDPAAAADAARLDGLTVEAWKRRAIPSARVRAAFDVAVRVVMGAEPAELSLLHFLFYLRSGGGLRSLIEIRGGAQETRFVGGAQGLALGLAARLGERVTLGAPVRALRQEGDGVTAFADGATVRARRALIALPPPLAARIAHDPPLPAARDGLLQRLAMGATTKCLATYERAFWREAGRSGEAIAAGGPVTACFDATSHDGAQPALVGFLVGRAARTWGARPADERRGAVLAALARLFGPEAAAPTAYVEQDWAAEPWTRGCPVAAPAPGALTGAATTLAAPIGRLHFAGTETATEWCGYMEGALQSAERAAAELLARR